MHSRKLIASLIGVVALFTLTPLMSAQSAFRTIFDFDLSDGCDPGSLVFDKAGNLYGAAYCGTNSDGVIYKLAPNADGSWTQSILYTFSGLDGAGASFPLTFDQAGNLYGTTLYGGASGDGVVFQLVPNSNGTWTENVLHSFNGTDGAEPSSALIFDQAGNLYGTTRAGGNLLCQLTSPNGCGVAFKLTPKSDGSWSESTIHTFCSQQGCRDGWWPSDVIFDQARNLYGTTSSSCLPDHGNNTCTGAVFKLSPNADGSWSDSVLHYFCSWGRPYCTDGAFPVDLIMDQAGNLYGTTQFGGSSGVGVVFELSPNADGSWSEKVLYVFPVPGYPGRLIFDAAGNLYGTWTANVGYGEVFKLSRNSNGLWPETVIHTFHGRDGSIPNSLIFDSAGHLFGTTGVGGTNGYGTVFEITP
jgi:uncharacterized repeat protein (TIGR03803 family)